MSTDEMKEKEINTLKRELKMLLKAGDIEEYEEQKKELKRKEKYRCSVQTA